MAKFAIVENHFKGMDLKYGWCYVAQDILDLLEYFDTIYQPRLLHAFQDVSKVVRNDNGHCTTPISALIYRIAEAREISIVEATTTLSDKFFRGCANALQNYKTVYFQRCGSYFGHTDDIKVLDQKETENCAWPETQKLTMADIKIEQWPGGKHWYVTTKDGQRITDGDMDKFNTYEYAEGVAERYIKKSSKEEEK